MSGVSGQAPQQTDSEVEICGQGQPLWESEGQVLSEQSWELGHTALFTQASAHRTGDAAAGRALHIPR